MEEVLPPQVFIRNQKGVVWGPLAPETVELLIENQIVQGALQVSQDGINFAFPGRFPELRDFFPPEMWEGNAPSAHAAAPDPEPVSGPPALTPLPPHAAGAPMAGPGAIAAAAQRAPAAVMAGPGARAAADPHARPSRPSHPSMPIAPAASAAGPRPAPHSPPQSVQPPAQAARPPPPAPQRTPPAPSGESLSAPPDSGDLAKVSPVHLYYLAASATSTGLLSFKLADRVIEIHFRKGNPEYVASDHGEDALAGFLLKQGLVSPQQIAQAEGQKDRFGGELIGALFGMAVLNPSTAFTQLTQRAQSLILKALLAESGTFTYEARDLPPQKAMPLGNCWGVLVETIRRIPAPELQRRLRDVMDLPIMKSGGRVQTSELRFTPRETRALGFIDGVRSLTQLLQDMPAEQENFLRVAFMLEHLEAVSFAAVTVRAAPKTAPAAQAPPAAPAAPHPPVAAAPRPGPPAGGPPKITAAPPRPLPPQVAAGTPRTVAGPTPAPVPMNPEAELPALRALAQKISTQNHFEVLGLTEKADAAAVKAAYFRLAKVHHPDTVPAGAPAEFAKLKERIFGAIGEANRRLSDDKSRAEYAEELKTGAQKIDVAKIFAAEEMFQKAVILVKAKKFVEAVEMLDIAIKANADEGEFYAWRGYARFFTFKEKSEGLARALPDIQLALKKNERCAQAHYFHGSMARLVGDSATAQKALKLALVIQSDHIDAQRELRLLTSKK
jgi:curved DNA-binding protein CbpA